MSNFNFSIFKPINNNKKNEESTNQQIISLVVFLPIILLSLPLFAVLNKKSTRDDSSYQSIQMDSVVVVASTNETSNDQQIDVKSSDLTRFRMWIIYVLTFFAVYIINHAMLAYHLMKDFDLFERYTHFKGFSLLIASFLALISYRSISFKRILIEFLVGFALFASIFAFNYLKLIQLQFISLSLMTLQLSRLMIIVSLLMTKRSKAFLLAIIFGYLFDENKLSLILEFVFFSSKWNKWFTTTTDMKFSRKKKFSI